MPVPDSSFLPVVVEDEVFSEPELLALAGFLAGYSGLTHDAYALDLRQYASYCVQHHLALFASKRANIEAFARELEANGKARAAIARRLCTVTCFYRYAEQEDLIEHSPAVHVRRPRLDYESHATGLDRNELGAMLVVRQPPRPRAALSPCAQRPEGIRSPWCRNRRSRSRTRPPHPDDPAQRR